MSETKEKPTATIERVGFMPMLDGWHMIGVISNHIRQGEFNGPRQITSRLLRVDFESGTAETENTLYRIS